MIETDPNYYDDELKPSEKAMAAAAQDRKYARVGGPGPMGRSELAILILQWESTKFKLDQIEEKIKAAVLDLGESVTVGNVKARYSKGRRSLDYETPCRAHDRFDAELDNFLTEIPEEIIPPHTEIDFIGLAKMLGVKPLVISEGTPSVKMELLK